MMKLYKCNENILQVIYIFINPDIERRKELKFTPHFKASRTDDHDVILGEKQIQKLYKIKPSLQENPRKRVSDVGSKIEKLVMESLELARESELWTKADFELDYM